MTRLRNASAGKPDASAAKPAALATRSAASRRGAETRRRMAEARALREALAGGPPVPAPAWGSKPLPRQDMSIPAILARLKAQGVGE